MFEKEWALIMGICIKCGHVLKQAGDHICPGCFVDLSGNQAPTTPEAAVMSPEDAQALLSPDTSETQLRYEVVARDGEDARRPSF